MAESILDRSTVALSHLWLPLLLPGHTWRLARLRLLSHRHNYELRLGLQQELKALKDTIQTARGMEQEIADMDLGLEYSRQMALQVLKAATARLSKRVTSSFPLEAAKGQESKDSEG